MVSKTAHMGSAALPFITVSLITVYLFQRMAPTCTAVSYSCIKWTCGIHCAERWEVPLAPFHVDLHFNCNVFRITFIIAKWKQYFSSIKTNQKKRRRREQTMLAQEGWRLTYCKPALWSSSWGASRTWLVLIAWQMSNPSAFNVLQLQPNEGGPERRPCHLVHRIQ